MQTLLLLVEDDLVDTLKATLPVDKAWVLDARYDAFRCRLHHALDTYRARPDAFEAYHDTVVRLDRWLAGEEV